MYVYRTNKERDAQGNVLAVYERRSYEDGSEELYLTEQHIYGSARLGMRKPNLLLAKSDEDVEIDLTMSSRALGEKRYELTNHLGNVLAVVSDKRLPNDEPDVISVSDYYPYGMLMPDRNYDAEEYRYGFNGQEDINELNGWQDYGERMYSPLTARFQSPDPIIAYGQQYPELSSYQFASNTPIWGVDLDGLEYLNANEARIEVIQGDLRLKIENFNFISRRIWEILNQDPKNWSYTNGRKDIGMSRTIGNLAYIISSNSVPVANINANDDNPNADDSQRKVQNPTTKQSNYIQQDKRYKERSIATGSNLRVSVAKGTLALNIANAIVESGILVAGLYERYKLNNNIDVLNEAIIDVQEGILQGMIPYKYQNINDLSSILNVVLQGKSDSDNKELYDIGINIYNTISHPSIKEEDKND